MCTLVHPGSPQAPGTPRPHAGHWAQQGTAQPASSLEAERGFPGAGSWLHCGRKMGLSLVGLAQPGFSPGVVRCGGPKVREQKVRGQRHRDAVLGALEGQKQTVSKCQYFWTGNKHYANEM